MYFVIQSLGTAHGTHQHFHHHPGLGEKEQQRDGAETD